MIGNTYIVSNTRLVDKLRTIPGFELDLGQSLTSPDEVMKSKNKTHLFLPSDQNIQTHYTYRAEIINKIAHLGNLIIYTKTDITFNEIQICNMEKSKTFFINPSLDIYSELNRCFTEFLIHFEFVTEDDNDDDDDDDDDDVKGDTRQTIKQKTMDNTTNVYENEESDVSIDIDTHKPFITEAEIKKNNKIDPALIASIKAKNRNDLTLEERVLLARSL